VKKVEPKDIKEDIENEVEKLAKEFTKVEKVLKSIKISPDNLVIPVGEVKQLTALGIYSDDSQMDLTHLGDWVSSNDKIAAVSKGKIDSFSPGETKIYVKFNGIKSLPAFVKVEGPKLVSIVLSPQSLKMSMGENQFLKAEGCFSDSSRKDITSLANWKGSKSGIIKIEKGKITPVKFGEIEVIAEYLGIQSLPANIKVVFAIPWLIHLILRLLFLLLLYLLAVFIVSYVLTEKIKNNLRNSLDTNPREFIINLYGNAKKILAIFDLGYKEPVAPLSYAQLIQKEYSIDINFLVNFTVKFEEARYSSHILTKDDSVFALKQYNDFLMTLFSRYSKVALLIKYCCSILHRTPLLISAV
jgi:hypothetical protein